MAPFLIVCFFAFVESSKIRFRTEAELSTHSSTQSPIESRGSYTHKAQAESSGNTKGRSHDPSSHHPGERPAPKRERSPTAHMQVSADGEIRRFEDEAEPTGRPQTVETEADIYERNPADVPQEESGEPVRHPDAKHHRSHMQQTMRIEESEDPDTLVESGSMVSTKHRHRDINAPVLGGVIGGVLVVALIMLAYKRYSEMRIRHRTQDLRSPTPSSATPPSPREVERQNDRTPSKPERPTKIDYAAVRSRK